MGSKQCPAPKTSTTKRKEVQPQEHRVPDRPPPLPPPCPHRWLQGLWDPQLLTSCPEGRALTGEVHWDSCGAWIGPRLSPERGRSLLRAALCPAPSQRPPLSVRLTPEELARPLAASGAPGPHAATRSHTQPRLLCQPLLCAWHPAHAHPLPPTKRCPFMGVATSVHYG